VKGAATLLGRLVDLTGGGVMPAPDAILAADLSKSGLTKGRAATIKAWAEFATTPHALDALRFDLDGALAALVALPGIGSWTAHYLCLRGLAHTDAFPAGDLGLRRAAGLAERALNARAERWRPWRAYAAQALWRVPNLAAKEARTA
jgi:AraC family transcriptional regulator of adaptative response / DNA-3-methyladenine glycosylase II